MAAQGSDGKKISQRVRRLAGQLGIAKGHALTYKSSVNLACQEAGLHAFEIKLPVKQYAWRYVYASPDFLKWLEVVPNIKLVKPDKEDSLNTQIEKEFFGFCYGNYMCEPEDIRRLDPQPNSVWELKTPDLRLFGWFPDKDYFIVHFGREKEKLLDFKDYKPFIEKTCEFRASLSEILPNYVKGGLWNVVSNRLRSF